MMYVLARQKFVTLFRFCCNMFVSLRQCTEMVSILFAIFPILSTMSHTNIAFTTTPKHVCIITSGFWQTVSHTYALPSSLCRINSFSSSVVYKYYLCYDFKLYFLFYKMNHSLHDSCSWLAHCLNDRPASNNMFSS